ncbi:hypothetical protein C8R47DRAFT_1097573 [Mycena vitilis]|nr:hypothetical protein C8R47DRAFT_1097573 [Mycena vitilis]
MGGTALFFLSSFNYALLQAGILKSGSTALAVIERPLYIISGKICRRETSAAVLLGSLFWKLLTCCGEKSKLERLAAQRPSGVTGSCATAGQRHWSCISQRSSHAQDLNAED